MSRYDNSLQLRFPHELREKIRTKAREFETSEAAIVRLAVKEFVEKHDATNGRSNENAKSCTT